MAWLKDLFRGTRAKTEQYPRFEPGQIGTIENLLAGSRPLQTQSMDYFQNLLSGDPEAFAAFERPALRQFEEELIPSIAERFSREFGTGSNKSSAFGQQLGKYASNLSERLAAQRASLQGGAAQAGLNNLLQLLQFQQQPRMDYLRTKGTPGLIQHGLEGLFDTGLKAGFAALGG